MSLHMTKTPALNKILIASLALLAALLLAGCGSDEEDPQKVVESALEKAADITSGQAEVKASILTGALPPSFDIVGGGPFDTEAEGGVSYDLDLTVQVAGTEQELGFAAVDGKSYLKVGNKAAETKNNTGGGLDPGSIETFIDSLSDYVTEASFSEERNLGKEQLKVYDVVYDTAKLLEDLSNDNPELTQLSIPGLGSVDQLSEGIKNSTGSLGVGTDGFPHLITLNVPIERTSTQAGVRLSLTLTEINQPVTIEAPENIVERSELGGIADFLGG